MPKARSANSCAVTLCREFKLSEDMYAHDSIDLLKDSGIDFARNEAQGIDVQRFGELLISSGIVLNDEVRWQTPITPTQLLCASPPVARH